MPEESTTERLANDEAVQKFQGAELTEHARRLGELESDLKAVIKIVESIWNRDRPGGDTARALLSSLVEKYEIHEP